MMISEPSNLHALFNLFLLYDPESGIEGLVNRVNVAKFDRRRIYETVLGRPPENAVMAHTPDDFDPRWQFAAALKSKEFRQNLIKLVCRAFPRHRRITFIHVPKCAGTDLIRKFDRQCPTLNNTITSENWVAESALFSTLRTLVAELHCSDAFFVYGHFKLAWLMRHELIRSTDDCFTVLRNPFEMALSQANYIVTRLTSAGAGAAPDVLEWLKLLDLKSAPVKASAKEQVRLAKRVLLNPRMVRSNVICTYLGHSLPGSTEYSAASAISNLVVSNLEITDTVRYNAWVAKRFESTATTQLNQSRAVLTSDCISGAERDYIESITLEDQALFNAVTASLTKADSLSIRGNCLM